METSSNNDSTASPATTARSSTIHNYQGIKKHLIEAIVFSADVFACRERLISYDNNDELTCKVDALFHRKRSSPYLSSHAAREIRQEYCEGNGNGNQDDYDSLRVKFFDTTSTCPSTNPSVSFPSDFYYSSIDNNSKSSRNSRRKKRKQLEAIPDVPSSLLRLLDVQHDNNNEFVEQPPSKTTTLLSLSAKTTAAADDITMTTKKSSSSKPRIRNKRRLLHDFIMNHIVCFKGKTTKSVVLESIQKEKEEKEKNENENHYHHQLHSHSHCHHNHHLSSTNTNTTIASLFHDDDDADADHDDDVNKKGSNTTHRRSRRRKNKKSLRHIMGVSHSPSTATATATTTTTTTNRTLCWQRRPASYQPFEQRRSCCVVMGS